jgi:hydrogenase expression/formation protein HypC
MCLAVPGEILRIIGEDPLSRMGEVSFAGVKKEVSLAFVPEAKTGDYVIVHVGFAISIIDEEAALESLHYFRQLDEAAEGGAVK